MESDLLYERLLDLIERSEARIESTREMVQRLSDACACNMQMYDKHLTSLEHSRDVTQENSRALLKNYASLLDEVKELRSELKEAKASYQKIFDSYIRISEALGKSGSSKADVKIKM